MSYKKERESGDVPVEIKKRFNKEFDGILPPCLRLSTSTRLSVHECIRRFGLQSVDEVFAQIKNEQFSLGNNKNGFIANFTFIFKIENYQKYLERAQLSRQKKEQKKQHQAAASVEVEPQLSKAEREAQKTKERRETLLGLVEMARKEPTRTNAAWMGTLLAAYNSGELAGYGIDWKPNNIK